jgi:hypothetical protein
LGEVQQEIDAAEDVSDRENGQQNTETAADPTPAASADSAPPPPNPPQTRTGPKVTLIRRRRIWMFRIRLPLRTRPTKHTRTWPTLDRGKIPREVEL